MTSPAIRSLTVKRFRSIPAESVEFDNPTFLVGRNGSGKSNLVDAFSFLAEAMVGPLQAVFDNRGGIAAVRNKTSGKSFPPNLGLRINFGVLNGNVASGFFAFEVRALPNYGFEVVREQCRVNHIGGVTNWFDRDASSFRSNIESLVPVLDRSSLALPVVGGEQRFAPVLKLLTAMRVYSIEPAKLRDMQDPDSGLNLRSDGSNVTSVLQEIERQSPESVARISEILATIVPNTVLVKTSKHGKKLSLEFTQEWGQSKRLKFEAFSMSDGTLRAVGLLVALLQRPVPSLIVIEEPEASLHPGALETLLDVLRLVSGQTQVVVTTHSPEVLDAKWIRPENIRMVTWEEGATHISRLADPSVQALQDHLMGAGELLRSNALDAAPLFEVTAPGQGDLFEPFE